MSVRITGLQEVSTLQSGDYIAVDNESNGTHKFDAMKMGANMASNIAPAYSTAATYAIGDFCMHDNILYKCTTAISTPESWTASHWTQTSAGVALAQKVDKVSGKGLSQNDFTNALKTKLDGIASGAEVNVQADWSQTDTSADDYIKNKPVDATSSVGGLMSASDKAKLDGIAAGAEVNVQSDWTETNTSSDAYIKNKPTNATPSTAGLMSAADKAKLDGIASGAEVNVQADWSQTNTSADDYIKNKPVDATSSVGGLMSATDKAKLDTIEQGAEVNVQADWNQTNTSADDYIKNKPTDATTSTAGLMSASDKTKLDGIETGAQVNVIDGVKVDGTLLTVDGNKDVDIVGKANQASLAPQYSSDTGNYVRGDYVIYQNNLYKCLQDTSGVWDATKWEQAVIGDDLEQKANIDGLYEEMTVGGAEQLISDTFNIESVPYNFRTSGGSLDIGDRETDKVVGGTVAWNQLIYTLKENQSTVTSTGNEHVITSNGSQQYFGGTIYMSNTAIQQNLVVGHRYLGSVNVKSISVANFSRLYFTGMLSTSGVITTGTTGVINIIMTANDNRSAINARTTNDSTTASDTFTVSDVMLFDLTAMFGTTIADYIYTLEQNTTGAGVAFFKKLFPAPYYAYNAGQLMSVNAGSHVMNGFNQWDEVWEVGSINVDTGENLANSNMIRSKNYIPVLPNIAYYYKMPDSFRIWYYDKNKNFLSTVSSVANYINTTPQNAYYVRFKIGTTTSPITTYNNDICINIAWDGERNGEYEPYVSHTYELDDTLELRGIPKLDENNQLYYDGDVYESDGSVTRNYGIVDLGTLNWTLYSGYANLFYVNASYIKGSAINSIIANFVPQKYTKCNAQQIGSSGYTDGYIAIDSNGRIYINDTAYTDAASFKTAMSGVYLVYELATPTTESATPYTNPQIVDDWGTETYTDYSYDAQTRDVQIPVGHETRYMANLKAKLEMAPESPNGDGDYIVRQTSGENAYVAIGSSPTIQHKAEIDGTYDDMNVGGAKQLLSNVFEEDKVPYNFRTSGGSIDIGDREYDEIVGGTVAWNQLVPISTIRATRTFDFDVTFTNNADGSITLSGTSTSSQMEPAQVTTASIPVSSGHVYFFDTKQSILNLYWTVSGGYSAKPANVFKATNSAQASMYIQIPANTTLNSVKAYVGLIDLTAMFGSTIADYIYSLETATAGAGVSWFKKLFPKPYYAYDAGSLQSVQAVNHITTGFNQWDEEWEVYGSNGQIRSKNAIHLIEGATYYGKCPNGLTVYFKATPSGATVSSVNVSNSTFTVPVGAPYAMIYTGANYGTTYNHDICINLHWDGERDGEYEPYVKHEYALDSDLTLRGIPKLDASNNLYYDGDVYESDGTVTRKYGIVDLGTLTWQRVASGTNPIYASQLTDRSKSGSIEYDYTIAGYNIIASTNASNFGSNANNKDIAMSSDTNSAYFYIRDDSYNTAEAFKTAVTGKYIVYKLATPTTESADPYTNPQIVDDFGTEEYVDGGVTASTPTRDVAIPVGHDTKYTANLRAKIEMAPDSPSGNGDYIMRQADGTNSYVPLIIPNELPTMPTTDGDWVLRCTVSSGTATLSWVSAT